MSSWRVSLSLSFLNLFKFIRFLSLEKVVLITCLSSPVSWCKLSRTSSFLSARGLNMKDGLSFCTEYSSDIENVSFRTGPITRNGQLLLRGLRKILNFVQLGKSQGRQTKLSLVSTCQHNFLWWRTWTALLSSS